ncbi:MAG: hypothetical protein JWO82_2870 [Akkermansiaceae bacterium]|nr:hypothetical protein [Akkermansiaceae bacterium]
MVRLKDGVMTLDQRFKGSIAQKDVLARIARDGLQLDPSRGAITRHLIFLYPNSKVVAEGADSQSCIYAKEMTVREEAGKSWVVLQGGEKIPTGDLPRLMKETR